MRKAMTMVLLVAACGGQSGPEETVPPAQEAAMSATATVRDSAGAVLGTLTLSQEGGGVRLVGRLDGLTAGEHGMHIHTIGQCTPTFDAAGSHWNPTGRQHGTRNPEGPHLGDLGNVVADATQSAQVDATTPGGRLDGPDGVLDADGAAVVVHALADDDLTDPSGASGSRVACGVIELATP